MPFHVELRKGFRRASAFNLDPETLRRVVLEPWARGQPVELGEQEWDPSESELQILEGPQLEGPDLAMGRGWHNAVRASRDVTAQQLERTAAELARVAVLAATAAAHEAVAAVLDLLGVGRAGWDEARGRITAAAATAGSPPDLAVGAVLLVAEGEEADPEWLFDAGLALGALGARAIPVLLGDGPAPPALHDLAVVRLDPARAATVGALAERLHSVTGNETG
jgi:hypothetical protein